MVFQQRKEKRLQEEREAFADRVYDLWINF